ncbi:hypothetical protein ACOACO_14585 [Nocardioides sp. CPCC 205120]|uniref:hypothetical protein n=1 Tax=Nocardioides sp. CPCC 205120 TaxID=3406462 RepID=UPI003B510C65
MAADPSEARHGPVGVASGRARLRVYTAQLRGKLETDPAHLRHLVTSSGLGYTLEP